MEFFSLASSSKGNCICVGEGDTHILIDTGITFKKIEEGLSRYNLTADDIDAILITHEHSDHIKGLGVISRKKGIPIYTTRGTRQGILDVSSLGQINTGLFNEIRYDEAFDIGSLNILPFKTSHDASEPCDYVITHDDKRIAVVTDLGVYDDYTVDNLSDLNAIFLEANYDYNMLQVGPYQPWLKKRVHSDMGHLSNEMSGQLICDIACSKLTHIVLGHMSNENNVPELAREAVRCEILLSDVPYAPDDFEIICAPRYEPSEKIVI